MNKMYDKKLLVIFMLDWDLMNLTGVFNDLSHKES